MIGIPIQIFPEVIEAMNNLYAEMRGVPLPETEIRAGGVNIPSPAPPLQQIAKTEEDEEDELIKKVWGR